MSESKKSKKTNILEEIKSEAKEYYSDKNMPIRYVVIAFLLILLVLQFIFPHKKNQENTLEQKNPEVVTQDSDSFEFLWEIIDVESMNNIQKIYFDISKQNIISKNFENIYKWSQLFIPQVQEILQDYDVPTEFSYLLLNNYVQFNNIDYPTWTLSDSTWKELWLKMNDEVYETLNLKKSTEIIAEYFSDLYDEFWDWKLVMSSYLMWYNDLKQEIKNQWTDDFDELYLRWIDDYYTVMWYSYLFQNSDDISDDIELYEFIKTKTISVWEIKNLQKRADKNWSSYKEIRELNPRILWNSIPKWKWEIIVKK